MERALGGEEVSSSKVPHIVKSTGKDFFSHYAYVDNAGVLGTTPVVVLKNRIVATEDLDAVGFATHELTEALEVDELSGIVVDGARKLARLSDRRFSKVCGCLQWALLRDMLSGRQLERLVGHSALRFLIRRLLLSTLSACYRFVKSS